MFRKCVLAAALLAMLIVPALAQAQKLVYVVRHAERADDGSMQTETDPVLSTAGEARAAKLAVMFADAGVKAIYVTQFKRTQQTAAPLAAKLKIATMQAPLGATELIAQLKAQHANDVVMVVAHSSTIPAIVKAFGGPVVTVGDFEYHDIFVVVPATGTLSRIRY